MEVAYLAGVAIGFVLGYLIGFGTAIRSRRERP